jgi:hypothetical protein
MTTTERPRCPAGYSRSKREDCVREICPEGFEEKERFCVGKV